MGAEIFWFHHCRLTDRATELVLFTATIEQCTATFCNAASVQKRDQIFYQMSLGSSKLPVTFYGNFINISIKSLEHVRTSSGL